MVNDLETKREESRAIILAEQFSEAASKASDKSSNIYITGALCTAALAVGVTYAGLPKFLPLATLAITFGWSYLGARNAALSLKNKFNQIVQSGSENDVTLAELTALQHALEEVPGKGLPALKQFSGKTLKSPLLLTIGAAFTGAIGWIVSPLAMPLAMAITISMMAKTETDKTLRKASISVFNVRMEQSKKISAEIDGLLAEAEQTKDTPAANGPELKP